jgi:hypothetical protein
MGESMDTLCVANKNQNKQIYNVQNTTCNLHRAAKSKIDFYEEVENRKRETSLWKAVVMQALVDLASKSNKKMAKIHRIRSIMWLNLLNKDFLTTCSLASLDPYYVYQKAQEIKSQNPLI